jgi:hypothetical protein
VDEAKHLAIAERHIVEAEARVASQYALVASLERAGRDAVDARRLLAMFETTLAQMIAHRDLILKEIAAGAR